MSSTKLIDEIDKLSAVLSRPVEYDGELLTLTEGLLPGIPDWALNVLLYPKEIPGSIFCGYEALGEAEVVDYYKNREDPLGFFNAYKYQSDYLLTEDQAIFFDETPDGRLDEPQSLRDIRAVLPLFRVQGNFLVCDFSDQSNGALLDILYGHDASFVAPGMSEHLQDLREGLSDGSYWVSEDDEAVYPFSSWQQRIGVRRGDLEMDEWGEVKEPRSSVFGKLLSKLTTRKSR